MKSKSIILVAILMALPSAMMAQKNIQKAFDALQNDNIVKVTTQHSLERDPDTGKTISQVDVFDFMMTDPSVFRHIKDIQDAFGKDTNDAYLVKSGDHTGDNYFLLTVGDGSSQSVAIGKMKGSQYIYACFLDKNDSEKKHRYAYALEWVEDEGNIRGRLAITYALMPKYQQKRIRNITIKGNSFPMTDFTLNYDTLFTERPKSPTVWLSEFNTLSSLYRKNSEGGAAPVNFALLIYGLCKNTPSLDDYEKDMVITELKELKKITKRQSIQGFFTKSIELLKK